MNDNARRALLALAVLAAACTTRQPTRGCADEVSEGWFAVRDCQHAAFVEWAKGIR